jgi:hypothetical protein
MEKARRGSEAYEVRWQAVPCGIYRESWVRGWALALSRYVPRPPRESERRETIKTRWREFDHDKVKATTRNWYK